MKHLTIFLLLLYGITDFSYAQQTITRTTMVDGKEREYIVHIPASYNGTAYVPLVFMLHGTGGNGNDMFQKSGWAELSEIEGFIAVFPSSLRYKIIDHEGLKTITKWNTTPDAEFSLQPGEVAYDDIKFLNKIIAEIKLSLKINAKRIYLNGFSNGGSMASKCSIEMGDVLAAVCCNAAAFFLDTTYVPKRKLPLLFQIGNRDYGPGNVGPEFPQVPMHLFDSLISTPGIAYLNGKHYRVAKNATNNFSLKSKHIGIKGDTSFAIFTTYLPIDPMDDHEFRYVFVKNLGHSYPDWAPTKHWEWMKKYTLDGLVSTDDDNGYIHKTLFYPNPASSHLIFYNEVDYKIMDISGKTLVQGKSNDVMIDNLSNGLYLIQVDKKVGKLAVVK